MLNLYIPRKIYIYKIDSPQKHSLTQPSRSFIYLKMKVKNSAVNFNEKAKEKKKITIIDIPVAGGLMYQFVVCETGHVLNTNDKLERPIDALSSTYQDDDC